MQSIPYLFADAVVSQLDSADFKSNFAVPGSKGCGSPNEFAKSVWQSAFATHRRERVDLRVIVESTEDEIRYYAIALGRNEWLNSITDIEANEWHFYRVVGLVFDFESRSRQDGSKKKISVEESLELLDFVKLHSSKRVLGEFWSFGHIPHQERILQKLDQSQIRIRVLNIYAPFPGDFEFLMKRSDDSTLEGLILGAMFFFEPRPLAPLFPLLDRFCLHDAGRPRYFFVEFKASTQSEVESIVNRVVDNWKAQPQNHVEIGIPFDFPMDAVELLTTLLCVTPVVEQETDEFSMRTYDVHKFQLRHQQGNEVLEVDTYLIRQGADIQLNSKSI